LRLAGRPPRPGSCPAARPTSVRPPGLLSCWSVDCCGAALVPPPAIRQLRDLARYRTRLIPAHGAESQRVQKTLEDAGIKQGLGRRRHIWASRAGPCWPPSSAENATPRSWPRLAKGKLPKKLPQLRRALRGRFRRPPWVAGRAG